MSASDDAAIRDFIHRWMEASIAGDIDQVLPMMAEDVIFIFPSRAPMQGRAAFESASRQNAGTVRLEGSAEVLEVLVNGDWAHSWVRLSLIFHDVARGTVQRMAGETVSLFRREPDGRWVIFRDVNMLAPA